MPDTRQKKGIRLARSSDIRTQQTLCIVSEGLGYFLGSTCFGLEDSFQFPVVLPKVERLDLMAAAGEVPESVVDLSLLGEEAAEVVVLKSGTREIAVDRDAAAQASPGMIIPC